MTRSQVPAPGFKDGTWIRPITKIEYRADGSLRVWDRETDTWEEFRSFRAWRLRLLAKTRELLGDDFIEPE